LSHYRVAEQQPAASLLQCCRTAAGHLGADSGYHYFPAFPFPGWGPLPAYPGLSFRTRNLPFTTSYAVPPHRDCILRGAYGCFCGLDCLLHRTSRRLTCHVVPAACTPAPLFLPAVRGSGFCYVRVWIFLTTYYDSARAFCGMAAPGSRAGLALLTSLYGRAAGRWAFPTWRDLLILLRWTHAPARLQTRLLVPGRLWRCKNARRTSCSTVARYTSLQVCNIRVLGWRMKGFASLPGLLHPSSSACPAPCSVAGRDVHRGRRRSVFTGAAVPSAYRALARTSSPQRLRLSQPPPYPWQPVRCAVGFKRSPKRRRATSRHPLLLSNGPTGRTLMGAGAGHFCPFRT